MKEDGAEHEPLPQPPVAAAPRAAGGGHSFAARAQYVWEHGLNRLLRVAPIDFGSAVGSAIVRFNVKHNRPWIITGARRNLRQLRPEASEAEIEAMIHSFLDNVGRLMGEFSTLHRMMQSGRVQVHGVEVMRLYGSRPILAIVLHTGNWEVLSAALDYYGISISTFYAPPETAAQREIAEATRKRLGVRLLQPTRRGLVDAIDVLTNRGVVAIFGDEARNARIMAPLFGRPPHSAGNLDVAARLARRTGATIVVAYCVRIRRSNFRLTLDGPFALPEIPANEPPDRLADVACLNALIEPIIRAHLDQWYFLDDAL